MVPNLSNLELEILRKLVNGETVSLSSQLRLRLELSGVIQDGSTRHRCDDRRPASWQAGSRRRRPPAAPRRTPSSPATVVVA